MQWQYFTAGFDRFIFEYNEGLHHLGVLADDKYITGSTFIWNHFMSIILLIAFYELVISHSKYKRHIYSILKHMDMFMTVMPLFGLVCMFIYLYYMGAFVLMKVMVLIMGLLILIYTNDMFIWLREKIDKFF